MFGGLATLQNCFYTCKSVFASMFIGLATLQRYFESVLSAFIKLNINLHHYVSM